METKEKLESRKDMDAFAYIIGVALVLVNIFYTPFGSFSQMALSTHLIFSFFAGKVGGKRKIGYGSAFFYSLFFTPVIGFILTFNSPKIKDEEYKEKMLEIAENNVASPSESVADQLYKLNELRKEGVLTDEEFAEQKDKLLKP